MKCDECGQVLPIGARFCTACGRRIVIEHAEPAITRKPPPVDPRTRTEPALMRRPGSLNGTTESRRPAAPPPVAAPRSNYAPQSGGEPWLRQLPVLMMGAGLVLGLAIYWSMRDDHARSMKAGADRIAAATGPLTTSQPALPGRLEFSTRHALQGLYGNYDPNLDGAYWTVRDAPASWAEWDGRRVLVQPLVSRTDETGTRHVVVTNTADVRDGMVVKQGTCRTCKSLLGVALYERRGNEWHLTSHRPFASVAPAWGAAPQVAVAFPAKGGVELEIQQASTELAAAPERRTVVLNERPRVVKTRATPRAREHVAREDSPFPSSVSGP